MRITVSSSSLIRSSNVCIDGRRVPEGAERYGKDAGRL